MHHHDLNKKAMIATDLVTSTLLAHGTRRWDEFSHAFSVDVLGDGVPESVKVAWNGVKKKLWGRILDVPTPAERAAVQNVSDIVFVGSVVVDLFQVTTYIRAETTTGTKDSECGEFAEYTDTKSIQSSPGRTPPAASSGKTGSRPLESEELKDPEALELGAGA